MYKMHVTFKSTQDIQNISVMESVRQVEFPKFPKFQSNYNRKNMNFTRVTYPQSVYDIQMKNGAETSKIIPRFPESKRYIINYVSQCVVSFVSRQVKLPRILEAIIRIAINRRVSLQSKLKRNRKNVK